MQWNFASNDGRTTLSLRQGAAGSSGHLTLPGEENKELFAIGGPLNAGLQQISLEVPNRLNGTLNVTGDPANPTTLHLTGVFDQAPVDVTLIQRANRSIEAIVDAYRRSFAVFTIEGTDTEPSCTRAVLGMRTLQARDGLIGLHAPVGFDYENVANTCLTNEELRNICRQDGPHGEFTLHIPKLETLERSPGPVIIQFMGAADHFADPPFEHPHEQIPNIFYEEYKRNCLSIEYTNSGGELTLVFNDGRKKNHRSIIIKPDSA